MDDIATATHSRAPIVLSSVAVPVLSVLSLAFVWGRDLPPAVEVVIVALLAGSVLSAVHHAEVVAHRVGEPFGSLILAVAVTIIEVGLIVTLMVSGSGTESLARDTVFAAVIITCNGIVGASLLVVSLRQQVAVFNPEGVGQALAAVITVAALSLVLPTFTTSQPGPEFSAVQLAFAAVASLALYAIFVFVQNVRHRDYFLPPSDVGSTFPATAPDGADDELDDLDGHAPIPTSRAALTSLVVLMAALVGVVGLAKVESHTIESVVESAGLPQSVVGVVIALLVLLPETIAAVRNASRDRVQISLNLALGSAMASIGLTIPAIAVASIWLDGALVLGLGATQIVLLTLTAVVGILTVMPGRASLLQAALHLVVCAAFLFLAAYP
jgi:Ca2+:H+ antiporter